MTKDEIILDLCKRLEDAETRYQEAMERWFKAIDQLLKLKEN